MLTISLRLVSAVLAPVALTLSLPAFAASNYASVEGILADNCVSCHGSDIAYADVDLSTEAGVKLHAAEAAVALEGGLMPLDNPEFIDTADGKTLLAYFKSLKAPK